MKNHAFIIPVHKQPKLLARSLKILEKENHYFFIHVSGQVDNYDDFKEACRDISNVQFVKRIPVYHGTISQVYATLILFEALYNHPVHFDYIHQISGQDYPLRSNDQFDSFFENTSDSFMCYTFEEDVDPIKRDTLMSGYYLNKAYSSFAGRLFSYIYNVVGNSCIIKKLFPRTPINSYSGGWDWFSWSDKVLDYVWCQIYPNESNSESKMLKRYDKTCAPCEHIFHTILINHLSEFKIRKYYPLRYVSWHPHRLVETNYRPFNLDERDLDFILKSPTFFCRKVDEVESQKLLNLIDEKRGTQFNVDEYTDFI